MQEPLASGPLSQRFESAHQRENSYEHKRIHSSLEGNLSQPTYEHGWKSFVPPNMDITKKYPALAAAHPFGGVKEQTGGVYASKMAGKGYVTQAFYASHQGESGGYPRDTENPAEKMEDIRCAIDYLTTLPIVDEERVGLLGICAGGSYVLGVGPTEMRAKAIASVSLWDLRLTAQEGWPALDYDKAAVLVEIGKQRTAQARGLSVRRDDGIPKKVPKGPPGIIKESYDYYRTPRAQYHTSRSVLNFTDLRVSWNSTTARESRRSRRARYCSSSEQERLRFS